MTMINRTYSESNWQLFKQTIINPRFDFLQKYYRGEQLPFPFLLSRFSRFSRSMLRSMLAPNLAGLIGECKAAIGDLKAFSRQFQRYVLRELFIGCKRLVGRKV